MKYVIKLGGAGLETPALLQGSMRAIADLVRDGNQVAVVHGGGVQLTRTLKALGKQSEFIDGLRVTDAETRDAALMVFAGRVNKSLVAALGALGQPAVGLSGGDGLIFRARKKRTAPDLGFVGEIAASDPRWIEAVWQLNGVPVLCSMALGFDGEYYNINASLREAGFFDSGSATPKPEALPTLRQIATRLGATPYDLRVEGHTDDVPIHTAEFDSNWELSSARATRIARLFLEMKAIRPERISAAGYAEFHPVASNDTAPGRAENRRVDLVVLPRTKLNFAATDGSGGPSGDWRKITDGD
jgi:acetylglutamate kinase